MTSKRRSLALSLLLLAGCGGSNLPAELDGLYVTDAVVGGEGRIRAYLQNPASKAVEVEISIEGETYATVPSVVKIPVGALQVELPYTGVAPGSFLVRASLDGRSFSQRSSVVSALSIRNLQANAAAPAGTSSGYLELNARLPTPTEVALVSSDPEVATVPATVTIQAYSSYVSFPITTLAKGISTLTATVGEQSVKTQLNVADGAGGFRLSPEQAKPGTIVRLSVFLNAPAREETPVTFSSSNPAVIELPTSANIPAGAEYFEFYSSIRGVGSSLVKATVNGETFSVPVLGSNQGGSIQFHSELNSNTGLEVGAVSGFTLYKSFPVESTIAVTSSTDGIVSIAPSNKWPETYTTIPVLGTAAGDTTLTFSVDGQVFSTSFSVVPQASLVAAQGNFSVVNAPGVLSVVLDAVVAADTVVNLTQTGPGVLDLPASVRVPSGSSGVYVSVKPTTAGQATIHAELRGVTKDALFEIFP